ncbi:MAG: hypothetical protein KDC39_09630 [Actinobacteria bacterium]|nr:hypothetical protein [Actinomycetota bacterium]
MSTHLRQVYATTWKALLRRRFTIAILVVLPLVLYFARDGVGQSVRALLFGITWSTTTVAFYSTMSARNNEPLQRLAGATIPALILGRTTALVAGGAILATLYFLLVMLQLDVNAAQWVLVGYLCAAIVGACIGSAIGLLVKREVDGVLLIFMLAGLQIVSDPNGLLGQALPYWSTMEIVTFAVDGPAAASPGLGLAHAAVLAAIGLSVTLLLTRRRLPAQRTLQVQRLTHT